MRRIFMPVLANMSMSEGLMYVAYRFSRTGPHCEPRFAQRPHSSVALPAYALQKTGSMTASCCSQPPRLMPLLLKVFQSMYCADGAATTQLKAVVKAMTMEEMNMAYQDPEGTN